jgi:hypothetical protein
MHPRAPLFLAIALCLSACPKAPPPLPPPVPTEQEQLSAEVKDLSAQAQSLLETQNRLVWELWTEGKAVDIAATYKGKEGLFSIENIRKIARLRQLTKDPREQRALTALQSHFAGEYLARELAEYNDAIANLEASLTFTVDGREVHYRELERLLANEKSAVKRRAFYSAAVPAIERLSQSLRRREERTEALVKELGYASYEAFGAELREADLGRLSVLAEEILKATQEPYRTVMERLSQHELAMPFSSITRADIPRLFRSREVEDAFEKEQAMLRVHGSLQGLGIDLTEMPNIYIDARDNPRKNPRPLTLAIEVPGT